VRKNLVLKMRPRRARAKTEIRLFEMNERQAKLFERVARRLAEVAMISLDAAQEQVESVVTKFLSGQMPPESAPRAFHEMRLAFPILNPKQIRALPQYGAPRGHVRTLVLALGIHEGEHVGKLRVVRFDMTPHQAAVFNATLQTIMKRDGCSRDDAWEFTCRMIGRLLAGAEVVADAPDPIVVVMAEAFGGKSIDEALALPVATEQDVRKWQFRTEDDS
jgi:hypothetical protein